MRSRNCYTALEDVWDSSRGWSANTALVELDLASVVPAVAGQSVLRIELTLKKVKKGFARDAAIPDSSRVWKPANEIGVNRITKDIGMKPLQGGGEQEPDTLPMGAGNQSTQDTSAPSRSR